MDQIPGPKNLSKDARAIFDAALARVDPHQAISSLVRPETDRLHLGSQELPISRTTRLHVVGAGKAAEPMTHALVDRLTENGASLLRRCQGTVILPYQPQKTSAGPVELVAGRRTPQNIPTDEACRHSRALMEPLETAGADDIAVVLVSGGGSSLLCDPIPPLTAADLANVTRLLAAAGAEIYELNMVRRHLSRIKGGGLAHRFTGRALVALIISDVVGDDLEAVASGPTVPSPWQPEQALAVIDRYGLRSHLSETVLPVLSSPPPAEQSGAPKAAVFNVLVATNETARKAAGEKARELGYTTLVQEEPVTGDAAEAGGRFADELAKPAPSEPQAWISGGETTVSLSGKDGLGGRNQELALATLVAAETRSPNGVFCLLSCGTDGEDGPTDACGAWIDDKTLSRMDELGLNAQTALRNHDSYPFFEKLNQLIITGPTGTNVMDIQILLRGAKN